MKIKDKIRLLGGLDAVVQHIKKGRSAKETADLMGYETYAGFKQALKRVYNTNFSAIYKETLGFKLIRSSQKPQIPHHVVKRYVDCGMRVGDIAKLLGFSAVNITKTFKREYSLTIREYKTRNGI